MTLKEAMKEFIKSSGIKIEDSIETKLVKNVGAIPCDCPKEDRINEEETES